jgi:hypothetical protein
MVWKSGRSIPFPCLVIERSIDMLFPSLRLLPSTVIFHH